VNFLPWTGPTLRASTALHVSTTDLFRPLIPVQVAGLAFVFLVAFMLGRRETRRLNLSGHETDTIPVSRSRSDGGSLRRPGRFWVNVLLTIVILGAMIAGLVDPAVMFMIGTAIGLMVNYPSADIQRARIDAHAKAALLMGAILLAAGPENQGIARRVCQAR
jgi:CitMHS family citrate-Mg2+:H+ or citrate-Ca2+:H+ symporter